MFETFFFLQTLRDLFIDTRVAAWRFSEDPAACGPGERLVASYPLCSRLVFVCCCRVCLYMDGFRVFFLGFFSSRERGGPKLHD